MTDTKKIVLPADLLLKLQEVFLRRREADLSFGGRTSLPVPEVVARETLACAEILRGTPLDALPAQTKLRLFDALRYSVLAGAAFHMLGGEGVSVPFAVVVHQGVPEVQGAPVAEEKASQ